MTMSGLPVRFDLGQIVATPGAIRALEESGQGPAEFLARHRSGDWGDVCVADSRANERALRDGGRLLSVYRTRKGVKLWVITEAVGDDGRRAHTTLLLPEDY